MQWPSLFYLWLWRSEGGATEKSGCAEEYYTIEQIVALYRVGKNAVYNAIKYYKVPSLKDGIYSVYLKTAIDKIFKDKKRQKEK